MQIIQYSYIYVALSVYRVFKVLSYFIETDVTSIRLNELVEAFRTMYGKSATFIDPKNVHQVTKTLNNLFLKRDLVS